VTVPTAPTAPGPVPGGPPASPDAWLAKRKMPPVDLIAVLSIALVVFGGILMASKFPRRPPLTVPIIICAVCGVLMIVNVVLLSRLHDFSWRTFFLVARWVLLAYALIAGLIAYSFVHNQVTGSPLVVISIMLAIFAVSVTTVVSFTVARYQAP
jgi:drug/metabolite transporter (DMT)-like permease